MNENFISGFTKNIPILIAKFRKRNLPVKTITSNTRNWKSEDDKHYLSSWEEGVPCTSEVYFSSVLLDLKKSR